VPLLLQVPGHTEAEGGCPEEAGALRPIELLAIAAVVLASIALVVVVLTLYPLDPASLATSSTASTCSEKLTSTTLNGPLKFVCAGG